MQRVTARKGSAMEKRATAVKRSKALAQDDDFEPEDWNGEQEWDDIEALGADARRLRARRAIEQAMENRALRSMLADFPDD